MAGEDSQLIQQKLAALGLDKTAEEFVESLPAPIKRRVEALQELQGKHDELESQFRKERAELEAKYEKLYAPMYSERAEIVSGNKAVALKEGDAADESKGVPEFWQSVLLKCDVTCDMIKDKDIEVLKHLKDIQAENIFEEDGVPRGFKLKLFFESNPFFTNELLEKTYYMLPEDDAVLEKAEGTKINWNAGKDVTVKVMKRKPKKGSKPDAKPQMKTEKVESFFNFFDPPQVPDEDEELDEDAMEELQAIIEADYEVGATIREKLIPRAVSWYTGEAIEDEGGFDFFPGDEDDDEDEMDGEGENDEADEDGAPNTAAGQGAGGAPGANPPECKQQ